MRLALALVCLLGYPLAGLRPFRFALPASRNGVVRLPDGGLGFHGRSLAHSAGPPTWVREPARLTPGGLRVSLRFRPATEDAFGPARIFTLSRDAYARNLTIGQDGRHLAVRVRRAGSDDSGTPALLVRDVLDPTREVRVDVSVSRAHIRITIDGRLHVEEAQSDSPFTTWSPQFRLALGNELDGHRPWQGEIHEARVEALGQTVDYLQPGALVLPHLVLHLHASPRLLPFRHARIADVIVNLLGFVPLGLWLAGGRGARARGLRPLALALGVSLAIECAQLFIPGRYPSVTDLLLNGTGAAVGIWLARRLRARAPAPA